MAKLRKLTPKEEEANRKMGLGAYAPAKPSVPEQGTGSYDKKRQQMIDEQKAKAAAKVAAEQADPNRPSKGRQEWISSKVSGLQALISSMAPKKKKK